MEVSLAIGRDYSAHVGKAVPFSMSGGVGHANPTLTQERAGRYKGYQVLDARGGSSVLSAFLLTQLSISRGSRQIRLSPSANTRSFMTCLEAHGFFAHSRGFGDEFHLASPRH